MNNRHMLEQQRPSVGGGISKSREDRRAFARSMRAVGHTLEDIAGALNVSRERVRQLLVGRARGITSRTGFSHTADPIRIARLWHEFDGNAQRIAACLGIGDQTVLHCARELGLPSRQSLEDDRKRQRMLGIVRTLATKLGRTPMAWEIGEQMGSTGRNSQSVSAFKIGERLFGTFAEMMRRADCEPRKRGGKVRRLIVCRRGHAFSSENTYTSPAGARRCRICDRARKSRYRANRRTTRKEAA